MKQPIKQKLKILTAVLVVGCSITVGNIANAAIPAENSVQQSVSNSIVVTKAENDKTVEVAMGGTIQLRLPENATTGYSWNFQVIDSDFFDVIGVEYFVPNDSPQMAGQPGLRVITLRAKNAGESMVKLSYYRVWEGIGSRADVMRFNVKIIDKIKDEKSK